MGSTDMSGMSVGMSVDLSHQLHNLPVALGSRSVDFEKQPVLTRKRYGFAVSSRELQRFRDGCAPVGWVEI